MSITLTKGYEQENLNLRNDQEEIRRDIKRVKKLIEHGGLNKKQKKQARELLSRLLDEHHLLGEKIKNNSNNRR